MVFFDHFFGMPTEPKENTTMTFAEFVSNHALYAGIAYTLIVLVLFFAIRKG